VLNIGFSAAATFFGVKLARLDYILTACFCCICIAVKANMLLRFALIACSKS